ncbi:YkgJ family cysteine cluster protein [Candidatus Woesearchaeota archaeon]|nr:YkgJ family cysteine cluster protein [Candidatus Woesearchaeota archaeon]
MENNDRPLEQPIGAREDLPSFSITKETPIGHVLRLGKECEKCGHCCSYGSCYFLSEDIDRISSRLGIPKEEFIKEHLDENIAFNTKVHKAKTNKKPGMPYGECVFFDKDEGCTIHDIKPLHGRVGKGCGEHGQELSIWFMLNYLVNPADPESIRQWAVYLKTHPTIPGGELEQLVKDKELLRKIISYEKLR